MTVDISRKHPHNCSVLRITPCAAAGVDSIPGKFRTWDVFSTETTKCMSTARTFGSKGGELILPGIGLLCAKGLNN